MAATKNLENFETGSTVTCTLTSLATASSRESAVIDNSTNLFLDDLITLTFTIASGSPSTGGSVNIYACASMDGSLFPKIELLAGGTFQTGAGDASVGALAVPSNLRMIGSFGLQSTTSSGERSFTSEPFSVAQAFGGYLPKKYSLVIENQTGVAFSASTASTAQALTHYPLTTTSGN